MHNIGESISVDVDDLHPCVTQTLALHLRHRGALCIGLVSQIKPDAVIGPRAGINALDDVHPLVTVHVGSFDARHSERTRRREVHHRHPSARTPREDPVRKVVHLVEWGTVDQVGQTIPVHVGKMRGVADGFQVHAPSQRVTSHLDRVTPLDQAATGRFSYAAVQKHLVRPAERESPQNVR